MARWFDETSGAPTSSAGDLFAVVDAARSPAVLARLAETSPYHQSLFEERGKPVLARVAPYLVQLPSGSAIFSAMIDKGWGRDWSIFLRSPSPLPAVRRHLRRWLMVDSPKGKRMYFRFYDPRVLPAFLPTCNAQELVDFFGPITTIWCFREGTPTVEAFRWGADGTLQRRAHVAA
jgi:hypothetical protein